MIFRKKKKDKVAPLIEINNRIRGFILDSQVTDGHELAYAMGCPVLSDEVAEKEEQVSDDRVDRIQYLVPLLYAHAHILAEAHIKHERATTHADELLPEELWESGRNLIEQISISTLIGSISQLVDMKLLSIPKKVK